MKILSYNLWDSLAGMPGRAIHIRETLADIQADILCLQEVSDGDVAASIAEACACSTIRYDPESGCALLAKLPMISCWHQQCAVGVVLRAGKRTIQVVSVHLPWNRALVREKAIVEIVKTAESQDADYTIIVGDFNSSDTSNVHRYLTGDCSLGESDAYYFDLALSHQANSLKVPEPTLDFRRNPRWRVAEPVNTIEIPQRFDRIYLKNPYPVPMPLLTDFGIFGTEVNHDTQLSPSDHYGVYAELNFPE